jgi:hypothetical protein
LKEEEEEEEEIQTVFFVKVDNIMQFVKSLSV